MTAMVAARPPRSTAAEREVRRDSPLRRARTCWGHLAGVAGVELLETLRARGWVTVAHGEGTHRTPIRLTDAGVAGVASLGLRSGREGHTCLDWTERQPHIGGALGRALVELLVCEGVITRQQGERVVSMHRPLSEWLATAVSRCDSSWPRPLSRNMECQCDCFT